MDENHSLSNQLFSLCRDRIRTSINVLGDSFGAGIVAHLSRHELAATEGPNDGLEENLELQVPVSKDEEAAVSIERKDSLGNGGTNAVYPDLNK